MWTTLKHLIKAKNESIYNEIEFDGIKYDNRVVIAHNFNEYYINSVKSIMGTLGSDDNTEIQENPGTVVFESWKLLEESELKNMLFSMPSKGSPDDLT
ncbi:hypothetical protein WA026_010077 [Henosepilachna vigintioctopunctata]|uniref:Uncharacterized protein n=1 Tax=Henosepilachna vigintioctopunctata TaxID=420089 RepID=A0AAW1UI52_9CUCU